jgi:hypothetical protein
MDKHVTMSSPAEIVSEFLYAFASGDIGHAWLLASDDFSFQGPLHQGYGSKDIYFSGARDKIRFIKSLHILRQWEDCINVSTLYELVIHTANGTAAMPVSEWHTVEDGKVTSSFMVFDSNAPAAQLMRDALAAMHRESWNHAQPAQQISGG